MIILEYLTSILKGKEIPLTIIDSELVIQDDAFLLVFTNLKDYIEDSGHIVFKFYASVNTKSQIHSLYITCHELYGTYQIINVYVSSDIPAQHIIDFDKFTSTCHVTISVHGECKFDSNTLDISMNKSMYKLISLK